MSSEWTWTCKDCEVTFPTSKDFVYHVDTCVPVPKDKGAQLLKDAALLLRQLIRVSNRLANQDTVYDTRYGQAVKNQVNKAWDWLQRNNLQGSVLK